MNYRTIWLQLRPWLIGLALTAIFLILALRNLRLEDLAAALRAADYRYALPSVLCTLMGYALRTARWQRLLDPTKRIPWRRLFPVLLIGFMANNVLPARLGELVRAYALGRQENVSKSLALATIVLERVLDGLTLIFFLWLASFGVPLAGPVRQVELLATLLFVAALAGLLLLLFQESLALRLLDLVLRPLPAALATRMRGLATSFTAGLHALRSRRAVAGLAGLSILVWLAEGASYYLLIVGFRLPLDDVARFYAAIFVLVLVNLGILIPSAPGYAGTFEFFGKVALGVFGVAEATAVSLVVVSHSLQYVLVTGLGLAFLWRMGMSLRTE